MPATLRRLPYPSPLRSNAMHNRLEASRMLDAGFTPAEIVREFGRVWKLSEDGKLSQKYDSEYSDGRKETRVSMLSSVVSKLIAEKKGQS